MRRASLALLLLLTAACGKKTPPPAKTVEYTAPGGRFSVTLPADWRVDETPGEERLASFLGPGAGAQAELITVSFFPQGGRWKSPLEYASSRVASGRGEGPAAADQAGVARASVRLTRQTPDLGAVERRLRLAALPAKEGFFAIEDYTDPGRDADSLDAFLASFKPR